MRVESSKIIMRTPERSTEQSTLLPAGCRVLLPQAGLALGHLGVEASPTVRASPLLHSILPMTEMDRVARARTMSASRSCDLLGFWMGKAKMER